MHVNFDLLSWHLITDLTANFNLTVTSMPGLLAKRGKHELS
jgi:hypothetical protein